MTPMAQFLSKVEGIYTLEALTERFNSLLASPDVVRWAILLAHVYEGRLREIHKHHDVSTKLRETMTRAGNATKGFDDLEARILEQLRIASVRSYLPES